VLAWREEGGALICELQFVDFAEAFALVTRVAEIAERLDHHPDIEISYSRVVLRCTSHDAGRTVTARDHRLAAEIDALLTEVGDG
jgi:4a-hydroxytetrahydrobiopterin dehydratase